MGIHERIDLSKVPPMPGPDELVDEWYISCGFSVIAGVDEVGRGALAGPVCASAVILGKDRIDGLNDSKLLRPDIREALTVEIYAKAKAVTVAFLSPEQVDEMNILRASLDAMRIALEMLMEEPELVLVDGNQVPTCRFPTVAIVGGDRRSEAIMAASIVAKVTRDDYMRKAAKQFPGYGFEDHKGYGVPAHHKAIDELGLCPIHRRSYAPCRVAETKGLFD